MDMKRIRKHEIRLQERFLLIFLLTGIFIGAGNLLALRIMRSAYNVELHRKSIQLLGLFAGSVQDEIDRVVEDSDSVISDESLQESLSVIKDGTNGRSGWYDAHLELQERIAAFNFISRYIDYVRLIDADGGRYRRTGKEYANLNGYEDALAESARQAGGRETWLYLPEFDGSIFLVRQIREKKNLSLENLGLLIMKVDLEGIVEDVNEPLLKEGIPALLSIYQGDERIYGDPAFADGRTEQGQYRILQQGGEKWFACSYYFKESGWDYAAVLPYSGIFRSVSHAGRLSLLLYAAILVAALLLGAGMIRTVVKYIEDLCGQFDLFARGEYESNGREHEKVRARSDEIGKLYRHFDRMVTENRKMIQENYVKQQLILEMQVANLRQQIGSHFIYNTLESIYCLAQIGGDERIATMTAALGKLLRTALKEQRDLVPLREDLLIAQEYLKIQEIRMEDRLFVGIDIDPSYESVKIPPMTIQPIVENAVVYAAEEMPELCEIRLYCRRNGQFVELVVEDNGQGLDTDILRKLEDGEVAPRGLGIGLKNINKRLKLLVGEDAGLLVERRNGRTLVVIRLLL